jgi:hypothetical protein
MDGINGKSAKKIGHDLLNPHSSHFILPFDASSSEQMKNRENWKLIIQEANPSGGGVEYLHRDPGVVGGDQMGLKKGRAIA